ncbi:hypothetical protein CISIN_1g045289mg [Citrus sinensis]|uniref:Transcription factor CBF/NF-Y/archaeal histone domain-containing protein n=1 Tax=Citrus sinensis TaxID=2711 RepID=A0A067DJJ6_CITSI|nr:hypothetical protein CISIN_1g045289mg [Citrus sinensis]
MAKSESDSRSNIQEEDRYLPIANISWIIKKAFPANDIITKNAKQIVQGCSKACSLARDEMEFDNEELGCYP